MLLVPRMSYPCVTKSRRIADMTFKLSHELLGTDNSAARQVQTLKTLLARKTRAQSPNFESCKFALLKRGF